MDSLFRYVEERSRPGQFLHAVLCNQLREAVIHADEASRAVLRELVLFIYNYVPSPCHGSDQLVQLWLKGRP